jgi:serine protease Do
MNIAVIRNFLLFLVLALPTGIASAATNLPQEKIDRVYTATFEVVVKKIDHDSLSYERPLPLDKIPYQIRNDKYWSIGTAFAIDTDKFITAAHVLGLHSATQYRDFYLRDRNGKVYAIDQITKFASNRDFIMFKVKNFKANTYLDVNQKPKLNTKVYAVGNAHGEGVVLRDGLYTSNTPEDLDGAWSWIRFSAAASPGNSGGPLLDAEGRVIGIVLRKSENENLNYALPIREVLHAPDNTAVLNMQMGYRLENMNIRKIGHLKFRTKLPLSVIALNDELVKAFDDYAMKLFHQAMAENKETIFPRGPGSQKLLHNTYSAIFPNIVWEKNDGDWVPFVPKEINRSDLGNNGVLHYGSMGDTFLFRIRKPDNVIYTKFITDGKGLMDDLLKGTNYTRNIGPEKIRVTSFGKPVLETRYRDHYGRVWILRKWLVEYDDTAVATMTLPTPSGSVTMMRFDDTGTIDSHIEDLEVLTDYLYLTYLGTVKEWQDYLAMKDMVPVVLRKVALDYRPGKYLRFHSDQIEFNYDKSLMGITDKSDLRLFMSYFEKDNKVTWDIARVVVGEDKNNGTFFAVSRTVRPDDNMSDSAKDDWMRLAGQSFPYNMSSYSRGKNTFISALYSRGSNAGNFQKKPVLFSVDYVVEGKVEQSQAQRKINGFMGNLRISDD